jgi:heavy metal sensor kinase
MKRWPRSIRGRLTLWYAAALTLIVLLVSVSMYMLVRQKILQQLEANLDIDTGIIATILSGPEEEELDEGELAEVWIAEELQELSEQDVLTLVRVTLDDSLFFITEGWLEADLDESSAEVPSGSYRRCTSSENTPYLALTTEFPRKTGLFRATVAAEAEILTVLRTLALLFLFVFPLSLALAVLGGYLIAGRVLAPVRAMATTAEQITSRRLSERLPVENPDDELGRLATVFNSTLSGLERSFEQLRRFTAEASHALRTPLTALRSVGEVGLQEGDGPEFYRDLVGSMLEETDRLRALVENLLTLTRVEGGQFQPAPEPIRLSELASETADRLRILAEERDQELQVKIESDPEVVADREMIRQAVMNLLDNAIRNTPGGGSIRVVVNTLPGGEGCLEVRDTGQGIPQEHLEHIFERFYSIAGTPGDEPHGSGLGLAIAEQAVAMNGGHIEVESEVGAGSVFRIVLPLSDME